MERLPIDHAHLDHAHLTTLISMLAKLAEVAVTFDPSLILLCWKFFAKFVCRAKPHLSDVTATVQPIIEQLSITMETKTKECVLSERGSVENQMFVKLLKLCRFLSTLIVKVVMVSASQRCHVTCTLCHVICTLCHVTCRSLRSLLVGGASLRR